MNNSTCPEGQLEPAFWDRPDQYYYFHDLNVALSSTVPAPTAFSTAVSTSAPASDTPTATASASSEGVSGGVIGGAVGGSLAGLIIIAAVVFFLFRRRRNKKANAEAEAANGQVIPKAELASPTTTTGLAPSNGFSQLESPEYTPKVAQGQSADETSKQREDRSGATSDEKAAAVNAQT
ncbi:hypothetical protein J4E90_000151 [Alternaria incomplexa]|uniref:uncharacterized protein n=1 Tax=Alternaria incomplexa TaxID=1187928 RepID=UPI00221F3E78|nr:uncharacterized protein J4E90_000151 [Alternaria incomplexa]KAI4921725.1 hypothetical protein J4E90_000151 [Alternaria incomplexa]